MKTSEVWRFPIVRRRYVGINGRRCIARWGERRTRVVVKMEKKMPKPRTMP